MTMPAAAQPEQALEDLQQAPGFEHRVARSLRAVHDGHLELDRQEAYLIEQARRRGLTWARIAPLLGVDSGRAAEQRYGRLLTRSGPPDPHSFTAPVAGSYAADFPLGIGSDPLDARPLGERVYARRSELGLSPNAAATQAGVSRTTLRRFERGVGKPSLDSLQRITAWLAEHPGRARMLLLQVTPGGREYSDVADQPPGPDTAGGGHAAGDATWLSKERFSAAALPLGSALDALPVGALFTLDSLRELAARDSGPFNAARHVAHSVVTTAMRAGLVEFAGRGTRRGRPSMYRKIAEPCGARGAGEQAGHERTRAAGG